MKIDEGTRKQMLTDVKAIIKYLPYDLDNLEIWQKHDIWFRTYANRKYPDNHPYIYKKNGKRVLEQDLNYELYPCDTNDNTIETAINWIIKNIKS